MEDNILQQKLELLKKKNEKAYLEFTSSFEVGSSKKGELLIPIDKICTKLYILKSGVAKQFRYKEDGSEYISWFNFEGDMMTSHISFVSQKPSIEGIKIIEDSEYTFVPRDVCYELSEKYHAVETFFREILEMYSQAAEERLYFLQALSAKQKYDYILKNMPHLLQRVPQKELSSFLGITRETLSRIRKHS
ncbi:Crp/Fnr family transcriptional regulator [Aquimarina algicola]|uniref:Crp/Fnr family transcriptional regulator n=1 Tax=Aquimarina algicola TaxID=2589995 RepID=A0A504J8M4_9FLAO|nr:Crp/Fnr family transcriptional regulator [Aquimarina algicola]TPN86934.1 Crp/Fnr family transcriptional regulator [Aquimarina algicola]